MQSAALSVLEAGGDCSPAASAPAPAQFDVGLEQPDEDLPKHPYHPSVAALPVRLPHHERHLQDLGRLQLWGHQHFAPLFVLAVLPPHGLDCIFVPRLCWGWPFEAHFCEAVHPQALGIEVGSPFHSCSESQHVQQAPSSQPAAQIAQGWSYGSHTEKCQHSAHALDLQSEVLSGPVLQVLWSRWRAFAASVLHPAAPDLQIPKG